MEIADRTKHPEIKTINKVELLKPGETTLDNGVVLYSFSAGTQDVIKIECVFDAGMWYQDKKLTSFSTVKMLTEGTKNRTASEIADFFDYYGSYVEVEAEKDYTFISLYTLNKHLEKLLPVFFEMIRESVFPQHELSVLMANTKQEKLVTMQRVNYIAAVNFAEQIFGKDHPYGQKAEIEDYDKVVPEDLITFHEKYYHPANLRIVASGRVNDSSIALINKFLGDKGWEYGSKAEMKEYEIQTGSEKKNFIPKEDAIQSGIRLGKVLFTKKDPDFFGMAILNTILGGYFGSRLMTNIRENKGYTYGIGSGIVSMKNAGYMYISSDVGADVREKAITEIYKEINLLSQETVKKEELDLIKNYMIGSFLRSIDGPFALAGRFLGILDYGFDFNEYYNRYLLTIKEITPQQLTYLAQKYLSEDSFYETIAGK